MAQPIYTPQYDINHYKILNIISGDDYKKIFPEQYYQKFGKHLKILQFEKNLFGQIPQVGKLKFTKRQNNLNSYNIQNQLISQSKYKTISKSISLKSLNKNKPQSKNIYQKVNVNRFSKIQDVIRQDKQQLIRFKTFNHNLEKTIFIRQIHKQNNHNIQYFTQKKPKNEIRILQTNGIMSQSQRTQRNKQNNIKQNILNSMYSISNDKQHQQIQQRFAQVQKQTLFCKFVKRQSKYNNNQNIQKSIKNRANSLNSLHINALKSSQLNQQSKQLGISNKKLNLLIRSKKLQEQQTQNNKITLCQNSSDMRKYQFINSQKQQGRNLNNNSLKKNQLSHFSDKIIQDQTHPMKGALSSRQTNRKRVSSSKSTNHQLVKQLQKGKIIQQNIKNLINKTKQMKINPNHNIQLLKYFENQSQNQINNKIKSKQNQQQSIQQILNQKLKIKI